MPSIQPYRDSHQRRVCPLDVVTETLCELFNADLAVQHLSLLMALVLVGRDKHAVQDVNHTVLCDAVADLEAREPIDGDDLEGCPLYNVDTDVQIVEKSDEIKVLSLSGGFIGYVPVRRGLVVEGVRIQSSVGDDVVLENCLEVLQALVRVEQKAVGARTQFLEGAVGRGEDGAAGHLDIVDEVYKVGLFVGQEEGGKLSRESGQQAADHGWRNKDITDAVDDAILGFLVSC